MRHFVGGIISAYCLYVFSYWPEVFSLSIKKILTFESSWYIVNVLFKMERINMKKTLQTLVPAFLVLSLCSDAIGSRPFMTRSLLGRSPFAGALSPITPEPTDFSGVKDLAIKNSKDEISKLQSEKQVLEAEKTKLKEAIAALETKKNGKKTKINKIRKFFLGPIGNFWERISPFGYDMTELQNAVDLVSFIKEVGALEAAIIDDLMVGQEYLGCLEAHKFDEDNLFKCVFLPSSNKILSLKWLNYIDGGKLDEAKDLVQRMVFLAYNAIGVKARPKISIEEKAGKAGKYSGQWGQEALTSMYVTSRNTETAIKLEFDRVRALLGSSFRDNGALLPSGFSDFDTKQAGLELLVKSLKIREIIDKLDGTTNADKVVNFKSLLNLVPFAKDDGTLDVSLNEGKGLDGTDVTNAQAAFETLVPEAGTNRSDVCKAMYAFYQQLGGLIGTDKLFADNTNFANFLADTIKVANFELMMRLCDINKEAEKSVTKLNPEFVVAPFKNDFSIVRAAYETATEASEKTKKIKEMTSMIQQVPCDLYVVGGVGGIKDELHGFKDLTDHLDTTLFESLKTNAELKRLANSIGDGQRGLNSQGGPAGSGAFGELYASDDQVGLYGSKVDAATATGLNTVLGTMAQSGGRLQNGFASQGTNLSDEELLSTKAEIAKILMPLVNIRLAK